MQATISAEGEIRIPEAIREQLQLEPGAAVELEVQGNRLLIRKSSPGQPKWKRLRGILAGEGNLLEDLLQERREERNREDAP